MARRSPGKYEGCADQRLGRVLYEGFADEECGDVCEVGLWAGLIRGKRPGKPSYIVTEDARGFVDYAVFASTEAAEEAWADLVADLEPDLEDSGEANPDTPHGPHCARRAYDGAECDCDKEGNER